MLIPSEERVVGLSPHHDMRKSAGEIFSHPISSGCAHTLILSDERVVGLCPFFFLEKGASEDRGNRSKLLIFPPPWGLYSFR